MNCKAKLCIVAKNKSKNADKVGNSLRKLIYARRAIYGNLVANSLSTVRRKELWKINLS